MAEIIVTSTADSGAGSLRQAIAEANDGDVILFDSDVFPVGQTTSILLSSNIAINKSVSIYGGEADGAGYTSGATKRYYVYRDVEGVKTKVYIDEDNPAQEGETILLENVCRVALDGQNAVRCVYITSGLSVFAGIAIANGNATSGGGFYSTNTSQNTLNDCIFDGCTATNGGGVCSAGTSQNTLNDCIITDCSATNRGSAVYSISSSQNTLNACTISGCSATNGGIFTSDTSQCVLNDCIFNNCTASGNGGGCYFSSTGLNELNNSTFDSASRVYVSSTVALTITGGITTIADVRLGAASITIADGAVLTITDTATINAATISSAGRGYLALAPGLDASAATLTNVVACTYGAGLESFEISADGATWTAQDLTTPILIETHNNTGGWDTLTTQATGGVYTSAFEVGTTARAFDGVKFFRSEISAYWQVTAWAAATNGAGTISGGDAAADSWSVTPITITPNLIEV